MGGFHIARLSHTRDGRRQVESLSSLKLAEHHYADPLPRAMSAAYAQPEEMALTGAISEAIVALYATVYDHHRTTAITYINDNIVICVLESILTTEEDALIAAGSSATVIDGRVGFQTDTEDEFTAAIERLTHRRVTAFLSANQTTPGVACELFFLDSPPLSLTGQNGG